MDETVRIFTVISRTEDDETDVAAVLGRQLGVHVTKVLPLWKTAATAVKEISEVTSEVA